MSTLSPSLHLTRDHTVEIDQRVRRAVAWSCPRALRGQEEDLAQAAMMRLLRQLDRGRIINRSYINRTVHSVVIDELRRRRPEPLPPDLDQIEDPAIPSPERGVQDARISQAIRECLAGLRLDRRRAVGLHLLGHAVTDVAERLGFAKKKADNLVYRGMADLRRCLGARGFGPQ